MSKTTKLAKLHQTQRLTRQHGQALLEGVIVLGLIIVTTVIALLFLLNVGLAVYRHQQVAFIANNVAQANVKKFTWLGVPRAELTPSSVNPAATQLANAMLSKLGLPAADLVNVVYNGNTVTATIRVRSLGLFGQSGLLPNQITIQEIGIAAIPFDQPAAVCQIDDGEGTLPGRYTVIVPCYRAQGASASNPAVAGGPPATVYQYGFWLNQAFYTPGVYPNAIRF
jgi:hypothetical protein